MKITYHPHVTAIIIFDGDLRYTEKNDQSYPLQDYFDMAERLMNEYGFTRAEIIDDIDGTCIAEMERDDNYDVADEPADYDDGTDRSYE